MPHPHMRGEYAPAILAEHLDGGSSPHAWGIQRAAHAAGRLRRFIPTCVGNTRPSAPAWWITSVHPHMRGEYFHCRQSSKASAGSSPHAWGIRSGQRLESCGHRFIPTCVGNTAACYGLHEYAAVHPHMRGEYVLVRNVTGSERGSSPHAWGILPASSLPCGAWRFIPTCVGNT